MKLRKDLDGVLKRMDEMLMSCCKVRICVHNRDVVQKRS
jgi:hypothetical protein